MMELRNITDIHTHILYGVDDGPKEMTESVKMALKAYRAGVRTIVATPHMTPGEYDVSTAEIIEKAAILEEAVNERLTAEGREKLTIHTGQEAYYCDDLPEMLLQKKALTIAGGRYALVEFDPAAPYENIFSAARHLTDAGFVPVIAHMERYRNLYDGEKISEMISVGALLSLNYASLTGSFLDPSVRMARKLVKDGAAALLASDMHGLSWRPPMYEEAFCWMEKHLEKEQIYSLACGFPKAVTENR